MVDRSNRYKQGKKGTPGGVGTEAKTKAEATAGEGMPHEPSPGPVGREGSDPGPEKGHDATWGVTAGQEDIRTRHKREHADMMKRHGEEHGAAAERFGNETKTMHARHGKESADMHARHGKEAWDHSVSAAKGAAEATAGTPKILGDTKSLGKQGSEP